MTMKNQVTAVCKSAHFHLRKIGRIRKFISYEACEKLIHAFVTSQLDCGNSALYGLPDKQLNRLQRMLHIAARILTLTPTACHITPIMKQLHWLPINCRIEFKVLLLTFKSMNNLAPTYLSDLLEHTDDIPYATRSRSTDAIILKRKDARTKSYS